MRATVVVGLLVVGALLVGGAAFVLRLGNSVDLDFDSQPAGDRSPSLSIFCSYASRTGAQELIAEQQRERDDGSFGVTVAFARAIARRAPNPIASDARRVAESVAHVDQGRPPTPSEQVAARRVDAYVDAHCG